MARFDNAIALATRLIEKNGQAALLRSFTPGAAADPAMPWRPGENLASDQTVVAVFLEYEQKYVDGELIRMGDQQVLMPYRTPSGAATNPQIDGLIVRGSEVWKIVSIKPLNPNGQIIMFDLQVRR